MASFSLLAVLFATALFSGIARADFHFDADVSDSVIGGNVEGYIINGEEAKPNSWHWMTKLPGCGGSLISPRFVLTAAHCRSRSGTVIFGAHNLTKPDSQETTRVRHRFNKFISHPQYNPRTLHNDIAVIELDEPVKFTDVIRPVSLPSYSDAKVNLTGKPVTMIGWGRPSMSSRAGSPVLRQATTPIISNYECRQIHNGQGGRVPLIDSHICTSHHERKAGCHGDSGSPVNWKRPDGKTVQVGIASFVLPRGICDREGGVPTGHVRVTSYLKWVSEQTGIPIDN